MNSSAAIVTNPLSEPFSNILDSLCVVSQSRQYTALFTENGHFGCFHRTAINLRSVTGNLLGVSQRFTAWAGYTETASACSYKLVSGIARIKQKCLKLSVIILSISLSLNRN